VSPKGKEFQLDWSKIGRKYKIILVYKGGRMAMTEPDWNRNDVDKLIAVMEKEM